MTPTQRAAALRLVEGPRTSGELWGRAVIALLRELAAEPTQDTPPQRPPTPVGWSDTDWLAHLSTMPPIAYALRDTLYGTSKAGVLRFCAANEPGAFAVYASPPQQRKPLDATAVQDLKLAVAGKPYLTVEQLVRQVERLHGITGEQK